LILAVLLTPILYCTSTYHDGFSDLTANDGFLNTLEVGIETSLQTGHELDTGLIAGIDGLYRLGEVGGERLLAEHVLAVGGTGLDLLGVVLGGGADPDGIDLRIGDNLHGISSEARDTKIGGGCTNHGLRRTHMKMKKSRQ